MQNESLFSNSSQFVWLGKTTYSSALEEQSAQGLDTADPRLLGFETAAPTVTLGRSTLETNEVLSPQGLEIVRTDRGGQATLHAPGQLVLFPVLPLSMLNSIRPRDLVCLLLRDLHRRLEKNYPLALENRGDGLYTKLGKLAFIGLRISKNGLRHGLAVNVSNDLDEFQKIRSCGISEAQHDRILGYDRKAFPEQVFRQISSSSCDLTAQSAQV